MYVYKPLTTAIHKSIYSSRHKIDIVYLGGLRRIPATLMHLRIQHRAAGCSSSHTGCPAI